MDEVAGTAELSSPWVWSPGAGRGDGGVVSTVDVVMWRWGGVTTLELAAAAEVNTQAHMPLFAPLLATLTLLLLLAASPRNPTL